MPAQNSAFGGLFRSIRCGRESCFRAIIINRNCVSIGIGQCHNPFVPSVPFVTPYSIWISSCRSLLNFRLHAFKFVQRKGIHTFLCSFLNKSKKFRISSKMTGEGGLNLYEVQSRRPTRPLTRKKSEFKRVINPKSNIVQNRSYPYGMRPFHIPKRTWREEKSLCVRKREPPSTTCGSTV